MLLVAADYHVARAKLLLWAEIMGSGCRIRVVGIPGGWSFRQKVGHWYNEAVKLPGSVFELVWYHARGRLLTSYPRLNDFLEKVKRGVLVEE